MKPKVILTGKESLCGFVNKVTKTLRKAGLGALAREFRLKAEVVENEAAVYELAKAYVEVA